ncbi:hypothetical protein VTK26DRAFT_1858 [Humicola hyalothermophila]
MTSKLKVHPLNGMHTAGIFSDMSIDGPEIGTLVLVVDRAKNLPNRKTIGKQDPYCAARLGKEAKKTTTDIRGGQTPRWDQELRFTVHDSPDYYQLKVSVFNDDKKTELIGEVWIDLRDIIVPGGGQSDKWHHLNCKGKYAGEVRLETTYYDSRPKPEKLAVKAKPSKSAESENTTGASGPRGVPKRRPLPSDPVTGKPPAVPAPAPDPVEQPPQAKPKPAPAAPTSSQSSLHQVAPPATQPQYQQQDPPRRQEPVGQPGTTPHRVEAPAQHYRTPERLDKYSAQPDGQEYSPNYQQQPYDRYHSRPYDSYNSQQIPNGSNGFEDDRPPPPPAHRSRTGSNPTMNAALQSGFDHPAKGTPPSMRHDVLRNEAHRHSSSADYPGRPTYRAYDSSPAALAGPQYSNGDQTSPARRYPYDANYDMANRPMQATVEDVPESPDSHGINGFRRSSGLWAQPHSQSQPQFDLDHDLTASPAPLNVGRRGSTGLSQYHQATPDMPLHQGANGYPAEDLNRDGPDYAPNFGRHSDPALGSHPGDQKALTYRGGSNEASNGYSVPPSVPPSLVPGIDPSISQEISERINQDRRQTVSQTARYAQQPPMETPPRGRTMDPRYDHDGAMVMYKAPPAAHTRGGITYTNGPSTSSVNVVIKSRAYSPNPGRDPSPNPHHQHTIRRKSVSPRPPVSEARRSSDVPFGPDSYDALNPSASSAAIKDGPSSRPDYHEGTGKIITHDGREVDPSDHLPMESWAPEPEAKPPMTTPSASTSARPSPSGAQAQSSSGRRPLRIAGRPQSMLPSIPNGGYSNPDHAIEAATVPTSRNRLQKKAAYRGSAPKGLPPAVMSGANGPGPGPEPGHRRTSGGGGTTGFLRKSNGVEANPLAPLPPHADNFDAPPPGRLSRSTTFDVAAGYGGAGSENYAPPPPSGGGYYHHQRHHSHDGREAVPPIPAKVPLALPAPASVSGPGSQPPVMSGALQLHSSSVARRAGAAMVDGGDGYDGYGGGGGGGGAMLSLEEELRQIDIGTGRSSRRYQAQAQAQVATAQVGHYGRY